MQREQVGLFILRVSLGLFLLNTGLVWGEYTIAAKPKDKPMTTTAVRFTRTYVKLGGQWL